MPKLKFDISELFVLDSVYNPREDSILLAEAIDFSRAAAFLDMGCGTGIQSINAALNGVQNIVAADISERALECTEKNLERFNCLDKIQLLKSDLFENIPKNKKFDLIAFNPPYVPSERIELQDTDGGSNGREPLDRFLYAFPTHLAPAGKCYFLQSSLNSLEKTARILESIGLNNKIVARKKLFFEELVVFMAGV